MAIIIPIFCLIALFSSVQSTSEESDRSYFVAAVFEGHAVHDVEKDHGKDVVIINLKLYQAVAEEAAKRGADILVFNEYGLFPSSMSRDVVRKQMEEVPDPKKEVTNPCNEQERFSNNLILPALSCTAQRHSMYVVANMGEIQPCDHNTETCDANTVEACNFYSCPDDGAFMYNTEVVFDREGNLIAKYHKNHLFIEALNVPQSPEYITFETDFGVFGMVICFDMMFKHAANVAREHGIDHLLYSTHWFDDIAPFSSIELQQAFALTHGINVLAADKHIPSNGTVGSGIYSKYHGALTYTFNPDGEMKLLVAKVPLKPNTIIPELPDGETDVIIISEEGPHEEEEEGEDFPVKYYEPEAGSAKDINDFRVYKSRNFDHGLVKLKENEGEVQACHNGFCCSVKYAANSMDENYYLTAFNGTNFVKNYFQLEEETCLLVRCDSFDDKECVTFPSRAKTVFHSIELSAKFTTDIVYATVTKDRRRLMPKNTWDTVRDGDTVVLNYSAKSKYPLLKAGLFGRCYERDPLYIPYMQRLKHAN